MAVGGNPPFPWDDGNDLSGLLLRSTHVCEAMQALTNRADFAAVLISDWIAYNYLGNPLQTLGQVPLDADLNTYSAFRHANHIVDLRSALEVVLVRYKDPANGLFTLSSLLQSAVLRPDYKHSIAQIDSRPEFDEEDLSEILKCIDLLELIISYDDTYIDSDLPDTNFSNQNQIIVEFQTPVLQPTSRKWGLIKNPNSLRYLNVYCHSATSPGQEITIHSTTSPWDADTVTWNTRPTRATLPTVLLTTVSDDWVKVDLDPLGDREAILLRDDKETTVVRAFLQSSEDAVTPLYFSST